MKSQLIFTILVLAVGWGVFVAPAQVILPFLMAKKIARKDLRLASHLKKIPFFKFERKADAVERLMKKPQNIEYMSKNHSTLLKWYSSVNKIWLWVMIPLVILAVLAQVIGVVKFAIDPKGEMERIKKSTEAWKEIE